MKKFFGLYTELKTVKKNFYVRDQLLNPDFKPKTLLHNYSIKLFATKKFPFPNIFTSRRTINIFLLNALKWWSALFK
ncbi:hypothetical protein BpHYR1_046907 [Brachionus plicatilis]|uniref:Uncharacterized protein n=1 Tax=Brachionus plicatilis TaxID=10195 RepID=A0A3M7P5B0_BRAPC|nr:hypothetical protein BpHYR1_046907 [Brachionus plicatilis]